MTDNNSREFSLRVEARAADGDAHFHEQLSFNILGSVIALLAVAYSIADNGWERGVFILLALGFVCAWGWSLWRGRKAAIEKAVRAAMELQALERAQEQASPVA